MIHDAKTIIIFDRYPLIIGALKRAITRINERVRVTGDNGCIEKLLLTFKKEKPDVVFIDSHIFLSLGITFDEVTLKLSLPDKKTILVFMASSLNLEKEAMENSCITHDNVFVIGRNITKDELIKFLRDPNFSQQSAAYNSFGMLTRTEREIFLLMSNGASLTAIANAKKRSLKTISAHKKNIKDKLCVKSDVELFKLVAP